MPHPLSRRSGPVTLALTALAAVVIGCGGGGGGGHTGTTGTTTSGTTTSGTTTSGTTTSGTTGIGGGADATTTPGTLVPNAIYYIVPNADPNLDTYDVRYIAEDGSASGTYATGIPSDSPVAAPDPSASGFLFFAAATTDGGPLSIYRNNSVAISGAKKVVSPGYAEVDALQVSRDGKRIAYVAATSATTVPRLYLATVGTNATPVAIGDGEVINADFSADGTKIAYETVPDTGDTELYVYDIASKVSTQVTNDDVDEDQPQFSKDGTKLAFSLNVGTSLGYLTAAQGAVTSITPFNNPNVALSAPSFNGDGTRLAFIVSSSDPAVASGIYTCDLAGANLKLVLSTDLLQPALDWTSAKGRATNGLTLHLSRARKRR